MTAGVHRAGYMGGPGLASDFRQWQGIHVGAKADCLALAVASAYDADDAGPANTGFDYVTTELAKFVSDKPGCLMHIEHQFRILMQMAPPSGNFVLHFDRAIEQRHFETNS